MKKKKEAIPEESMEYPFGFGFELMKNPRAMELILSMDDEKKGNLMKEISAIRNRAEMRGFLAGLVESSQRPLR